MIDFVFLKITHPLTSVLSMTIKQLTALIHQGEGTKIEFKTSKEALNQDAFDSICGFLNRNGGHLILGVKDNGEIQGVNEDKVSRIIDTIITNANNPQKLDPPYYLSPKVIKTNNKQIISVYVPESSQVHKTAGRIFDRNEDGDYDITRQQNSVAQLYLRKQNAYTENKVYPYLSLNELKPELFNKVRGLLRSQHPNHIWLSLNDEALLRSAGLYKRNMDTGEEGYTLAAALLFGTDTTIQNILPHHKIDAICRIINKERYDDRQDIRTNLIETYEQLNAFISKHLPEKFHIINGQRINIREHLFREIIGNLIVHQEFTNAFPAKLIIEEDKVWTENWNKPHGFGQIDPTNFYPFPKNPIIAKFFKEIGWVDELGSGIRNAYSYTALYTPEEKPTFIEGDIFKTIIPLKSKMQEETVEETVEETGEETGEETSSERILRLLSNDVYLTARELQSLTGLSRTGVEYNIKKLQKEGRLKRIGPTKGGHWQVIKK